MFKKWLLALGVSASVVAPVSALADEEIDPNTGALSFVGGVDYVTAYYFRGFNQEDARLIFQPYLTLYADVNDNATAYVGTWNSVHESPTPSDGGGLENWYESDLYGGIDFALSDNFTLGLIYTLYTYPGGAFDAIEEVGAKLAYAGEVGGHALSPYAAIYKEISDENGTQDTYGEVGIGPSFEAGDFTIGIPVVVGMSIDDYYVDADGDDEFLGFGSVGVTAAVPLPVPARYGEWTLTGGVSYVHFFAEGLEMANEAAGEEDDGAIIGRAGVSFAY